MYQASFVPAILRHPFWVRGIRDQMDSLLNYNLILNFLDIVTSVHLSDGENNGLYSSKP